MHASSESASRPWLARRLRSIDVRDRTVTFGQFGDLSLVAFAVLLVPWVASIFIPLAFPIVEVVDPQRYWLLQTVHQLAALALTMIVMRAVSTRSWSDWGFNLHRWKASLLMAGVFALIVSVPTYLLAEAQPRPTSTIDIFGIVAILTTHLLVIGTTQEVLYRGFAMGVLQQHWVGRIGRGAISIPVTGLIAAIIFSLGHIKPVAPYVWPEQLILALVYGIGYAVMFDRTRSLLGPALAHGFSNAAFVAILMWKYT
jgi:hypothetical protein